MLLCFAGQPVISSAKTIDANPLHIESGKLFINGKLKRKEFSLVLTSFHYFSITPAARGLMVISDKPFEGAVEGGKFDNRTLTFQIDNTNVRIESSSQILGENSTAWVKIKPHFKPDDDSIISGYYDDLPELNMDKLRQRAIDWW